MPYGEDSNDLPLQTMQVEFNAMLITMLDPVVQQVPSFEYVPDYHEHMDTKIVDFDRNLVLSDEAEHTEHDKAEKKRHRFKDHPAGSQIWARGAKRATKEFGAASLAESDGSKGKGMQTVSVTDLDGATVIASSAKPPSNGLNGKRPIRGSLSAAADKNQASIQAASLRTVAEQPHTNAWPAPPVAEVLTDEKAAPLTLPCRLPIR